MGLDQTIFRAKNYNRKTHEYKEPTYEPEIGVPVDEIYWRKFYDLHKFIWNTIHKPEDDEETDNGTYVELSKEDLIKIRDFCSDNRNYFDNFKGVEALCELIDHYDEYKKHGETIIYEGDY